jgi:predicted SprT family Zn-dependent metalloprotease
MSANPTAEFYQLLNQAFCHFNQHLFDHQLPWCMLTLQRHRNTMGYFSPERWVDGKGYKAHEIALNPAYFARHRVIDVLQTLVHEQCHMWQHLFGRHKSRSGYHNREWADKMESIGLMPSSTGEAGGGRTGQSMSDYPIPGGGFLQACMALCQGEYQLKWIDTEPAWQPSCQPRGKEHYDEIVIQAQEAAPALLAPLVSVAATEEINWEPPDNGKSLSKGKYSCRRCRINVWGKPDLNILCGDCMLPLTADHSGGIE